MKSEKAKLKSETCKSGGAFPPAGRVEQVCDGSNVKSEGFTDAPGSDVDWPGRSCSDSVPQNRVCGSGKKYMGQKKSRNGFGIDIRSAILYTVAFSLFTLISSCSDSFEPFGENDRYFFTIYGFLDASADTQWARIAPVRDEFELPPELPEMNVILEHLESGNSVLMNDSLINFRQGFNAINVWTDFDIEPDQSYHLLAENPNGDTSEVTVSLPPDFPTPRLFIERIPGEDPRYFLFFDGVERLADIQSRWYLRLYTSSWEDKRLAVRSLKSQAVKEPSGTYILEMFPDEELEDIKRELMVLPNSEIQVEVLRHQVFVASGGPEWDKEIATIDDLVYNLPDGFSNVENGLGYFVGIVSKLFPFESCRDENNNLTGCPLENPFW